MLIAIKNPGESLKYKEVPEITLRFLQTQVFGYIETFQTNELREQNIVAIINEEGKLHCMAINFWIGNDVIVGPAVFVSESGEDFDFMAEYQIQYLESQFGKGQKMKGCKS